MKLSSRFAASALALAFAAVPMWGVPAAPGITHQQAETQTQRRTATGTIASVTDNSIAINLQKGSNQGNSTDSANSDESKTMQFVVDTNTKIDGKPVVGSMATIEYKMDKDNNMVATHITVQS
ncbi:MAG TPA: hypothetical protein VN862_00650 [Candidatus Acidoferrales bacterium]|nr:hypothetical protein [Candidatus Acidoferrales bacterium]